MNETITLLKGGGGRIRSEKFSNGGSSTIYEESPTSKKYISEKQATKLISKFGVKSSNGQCNPNDSLGRTVPQQTMTGETICITPKIKFSLMKIEKQRNFQNKEIVNKYLEQNNLTEYVTPYMSDPVQNHLLKFILGTKNVDEIAMLNALVYSGIINNSCPLPNEPNKTDVYINPVTGKNECREPIPERQQISGVSQCPNKDGDGNVIGDPYAVEKYINYYGEAECRRPVISGEFSCPQSNDPKKTKHITLKNNVGICIEDPKLMKTEDKVLIPANLVYPDDVNTKLSHFMRICLMNNFTINSVKRISKILKNSNSTSDLSMGLSGDPHYEAIMAIVNNIKSNEDISIAKTAMFEYAKNLPEFNQEQLTINQLLDFNGIDPSAFKPN
jgi:hypothetical protein